MENYNTEQTNKLLSTISIHFIFSNEYLNKSVLELGVSQSTENCLKRGKIETLEQLINHYPNLKKIKGFGTTCIKDVNQRLFEMEFMYLQEKIRVDNGKCLKQFLKSNKELVECINI